MRLQLCKYVYNCTFCVERHTKKFKSPASDPFPWIRQFKSWRSIRTQKRFPKFLNIRKLYVPNATLYPSGSVLMYRVRLVPNWTWPSHPTYLPRSVNDCVTYLLVQQVVFYEYSSITFNAGHWSMRGYAFWILCIVALFMYSSFAFFHQIIIILK